jgi:DNA excision repair protein ERCC-4
MVWSRSLHATADMFLRLKHKQTAPTAETAASIGVENAPHEGGGIGNPVARDMLLNMPGVTPTNVHKLIEAAESLSGLAGLPMVKIQEAIGSTNGKALYEFLHATYPAI